MPKETQKMAEEEKTGTEITGTEKNYLEIIEKMKNNTVSKEDYERVLAENKTLAEAFASSPAAESSDTEDLTYTQNDIDALASKMTKGHLSNLDYTKTALKYREAVLAVHGVDPFLPHSAGYVVTESDAEKAQAIADGLAAMAEYANGDASLFNSELKRCCK